MTHIISQCWVIKYPQHIHSAQSSIIIAIHITSPSISTSIFSISIILTCPQGGSPCRPPGARCPRRPGPQESGGSTPSQPHCPGRGRHCWWAGWPSLCHCEEVGWVLGPRRLGTQLPLQHNPESQIRHRSLTNLQHNQEGQIRHRSLSTRSFPFSLSLSLSLSLSPPGGPKINYMGLLFKTNTSDLFDQMIDKPVKEVTIFATDAANHWSKGG